VDKNYNHLEQEGKIYQDWEKSGAFTPPSGEEVLKTGKKTFTVIMPPPNANDPLHVGHSMFITLEDILIRYHRMLGEASLWLPGTDHAGIETQFVFEKKLAKEGKSRFDFDRPTLYKMIWDYVQMNSNVAVNQMKKIGASADWSRFKFTLDPEIVNQVLETFIKLNNDGLIYRSERLVNYCTKCGTAYSDLEVEHEEQEDKLYLIKYDSVVVATTRPETLLGDVAVAVNPKDKRYQSLIGTKVRLPLTDREIPIITDEMVDMEFGTGAVKITPTHDANDWEVAERQGWDLHDISQKHTVIGTNGKMTKAAGIYAGLNITDARAKVLEDLGELLVESKLYLHSVGHCYRCHRVIEPLPMSQFFIKVKSLTEKALNSLDSNESVILGAGRDKILRHWLENLKDWNISRQIVWGIQMPVWYKDGDKTDYVVSIEKPEGNYIQETDTFDTWFSSGQWPVLTLKNNVKGDFEAYYPTTVMETAYDILPFWVMRMMMLCIYMTGKSPFKYVYLHGLVRDEKGQKMSKSKGNVVNPLDLTAKYGTDSLRMALVMSTVPGQDSNTGEDKVRGMRNFANKIWNAGRYVSSEQNQSRGTDKNEEDVIAKTRMTKIIEETSRLLNELKIGLAAEQIYNEFWHWFCDELIEKHKQSKVSDKAIKSIYLDFLKLLHPFVPFVTEAVWQQLNNEGLLISAEWPK
jgi:valyl-tRNA synthetase